MKTHLFPVLRAAAVSALATILQSLPARAAQSAESIADWQLAHLRKAQDLDFKGEGKGGLWMGCASLFMAPPALMRLCAAAGDVRYLDCAVTNWWRTSDFLHDRQEHRFYRDSSCFRKREANGKKVFWGRGCGGPGVRDGKMLHVSSTITCYLGAGWSESGDFPDARAWESTVRDFALRVKAPLVVKID